jgi:hypothetical protein
MKDISFTQEFFLCALKPRGSTALAGSVESFTCLLAGMLLELLMDGYIEIDEKKKVIINKALSTEKEYLASIYEFIRNNKPMKVETIAEKYAFDFKKPEEMFRLVGRSLVIAGYATEEGGKGLFKNKVSFIPNEKEVTKVIEKLRAEFLEQGEVSDEVVVLGTLLSKSGLIKNYFARYEVQKLNERLKEIKQSEAGIIVKRLVDYIDTWIVIICASGSGV